ncbi:MAG: hypothetical protein DRO39_00780 [Thermoprotei archaeon]|nr:MAG: hypothetical protein DRO39_00780 [Thermoprotei archaeon]
MSGVDRQLALKKMSELLRAGATMLSETCPICGLPLFKLKSGEVVCPIHGRIFIARTEEEVAEASTLSVLTELEKAASAEISKFVKALRSGDIGNDPTALRTLAAWLDIIERVERIKQYLQQGGEKPRGKS